MDASTTPENNVKVIDLDHPMPTVEDVQDAAGAAGAAGAPGAHAYRNTLQDVVTLRRPRRLRVGPEQLVELMANSRDAKRVLRAIVKREQIELDELDKRSVAEALMNALIYASQNSTESVLIGAWKVLDENEKLYTETQHEAARIAVEQAEQKHEEKKETDVVKSRERRANHTEAQQCGTKRANWKRTMQPKFDAIKPLEFDMNTQPEQAEEKYNFDTNVEEYMLCNSINRLDELKQELLKGFEELKGYTS